MITLIISCGSDNSSDDLNYKDGSFRFIVLSDTHIRLPFFPDDYTHNNSRSISNLEHAVSRINNEFPGTEFVAVTGDLVGCLFSEEPDDYNAGIENPAETFRSIMDRLNVPYYALLGNHDYQKSYDIELEEGISTSNIEKIEAVWKKVLGVDPYYSIVHKGIRFIFLNSNRGKLKTETCIGCTNEAFCTGSFDDSQMEWLNEELHHDEPVIIFQHHPLFTDSANALFSVSPTFYIDREDPYYKIMEESKDKIIAVFSGHGHIREHDKLYKTIDVYETDALGDFSSNQDNFHIVDVNPAEKRILVSTGREDENPYWGE